MEAYQSAHSAYYYANPEVQLANESYDFNNYFVSHMNFHVDVTSHNNSRHVASANYYVDNGPYHTHPEYHGQEPMSTMSSSSFNFTSSI